ncbi:MAG TPA: diguanylate cyclase [Holophagaceae bacterium]|nr:diguanylate cyclase [Holophagaceae bacterium]
MNLLVATQHADLVERLRMAFEGKGHHVLHLPDTLHALADEAWNQAQLILVDAVGDPLDGYRFCQLLRGEVRDLFRNLPILLISDREPDALAIRSCGADGWLRSTAPIQELLETLGPVMDSSLEGEAGPDVKVLGVGLSVALGRKLAAQLGHFHLSLQLATEAGAGERLLEVKPSLLLLGTDSTGEKAIRLMEALKGRGPLPPVLVLGRVPDEAHQRRLLLSGIHDWLGLPVTGPRLLHACRRALEWARSRRLRAEYEGLMQGLREQRTMLEIEAAALRTEVLTDPLTGLLNRRAFDQNLEHHLNQWARHKRPFVLVLGDVDHFKLVNDRFGHSVGDEVLKAIAARVRSGLRRSDLAFRIGGEEFAVILPETAMRAGSEVAEKLRRRVDEDPLALTDGRTLISSISLGVGHPGAESARELVDRVDAALYRAKQSGRNQVAVAG